MGFRVKKVNFRSILDAHLRPNAVAPTTALSHNFCSRCCSHGSITNPSDARESENNRHCLSDVMHTELEVARCDNAGSELRAHNIDVQKGGVYGYTEK